MCTGRIDLAFVLRALAKGADGVFIAGCRLNECNYATQGNFYALSMASLCRGLLRETGLNPGRLRLELLSGGEGTRFADGVNDFTEALRSLGPLGTAEGLDPAEAARRLEALTKLVPYIKIQMREKLQARLPSQEAYETLYSAEEVHRLLRDVTWYHVDPTKCQACMVCAKRCPVGAIEGGKGRVHVIDQDKCIKCGCCFQVCPPRFAAVTRLAGTPPPPPPPEDQRAVMRPIPRKA